MAIACSSAMLTVPLPPRVAEALGASCCSRVSTARVGGSSFISDGDDGASGDGAMAKSWSAGFSAGLGAALLAFFRATFLVAAFGIGKYKFSFEDWAGPIRLTHWMQKI